jgi:general secretion pathway protein G
MINKIKNQLISGFTLVELLIVVIILAILAAIVIPQFGQTTDDAKLTALDADLAIFREAIDLYASQHGHFPGAVRSNGTCAVGANIDTATPGAAAFVAQMTQYTTVSGVACTESNAEAGGLIRYGPYLRARAIPNNPMTGINQVVAIQTGALDMSGSGTDEDGGWLYDFIIGKIIADQPSYGNR